MKRTLRISVLLISVIITLLLSACGEYRSVRTVLGKIPEEGDLNGTSYNIRQGDIDNKEYSIRGYILEEAPSGEYSYTICSGERPSGGYNIEIVDIMANELNEWEVIVREKEPGKDASATAECTYPCCVLVLSREPSVITIRDNDGVKFEMLSSGG